MRPRRRPRGRVAVAAALVVVGCCTGTAWAAFTATTENPDNAIAAPDLSPPVISRATVARVGAETTPNRLRRRASLYTYAQVTDAGQPPSGTASVVVGGVPTTAGGPFTVGGSTYNWRSAVQTAPSTWVPGSDQPYVAQATDAVGYAATLGGLTAHVESYDEVVRATAGLRNYLRLAETTGTTAADVQGVANGTYSGSPTARGVAGALDGDANAAAGFDGSNDYVDLARSVGDDLSLEFWFKASTATGTNALWSSNTGLVDATAANTVNDFGTSIRSDGRLTAGTGNPDTTITTPAGTSYLDGRWHHVVFTRLRGTSSSTLRLYVDGTQRVTGTSSNRSTLSAATRLRIGGIQTGTPYLNGQVDEVATYTTALAATTVSDHYAIGTGTG